LTAKDFYDICYPYTDGYFRRLSYDFSQILIASEVLISVFTKHDKNAFYRIICDDYFFGFLGNVLVYIQITYKKLTISIW